jgi:hypothetical protein
VEVRDVLRSEPHADFVFGGSRMGNPLEASRLKVGSVGFEGSSEHTLSPGGNSCSIF